eukprot:CAMPEP_0176436612 /NCGR_PEP_ID=MMETSP0127-20121128/18077_1 /TAXON_ID=938130 /ORGANISM="Platyophrya macrostoma, Strain WH" /LENGTH=474 /DNA_ID=CAMNT_0017819975 /DNA_START=77 /DNA_END=1501 /DNA_ORIENTATION=-
MDSVSTAQPVPLVAAAAPVVDPPPAASVPATQAPASDASKKASVTASSDVKPPNFERPIVALTVHLMRLLKTVNTRYCQKRRLSCPGAKYNNGYDDKEGHYIVLAGEEILERYTVQEVVGKGSFGTVLKCWDDKRQESVAMKITRVGQNFRNQAKLEIDILLKLNNHPKLGYLVVKLLKVFDWQGHLVLVFELLSYNLYQLLKCTKYAGVSLDLVRKFAYQLVQVLLVMEQHKPPIIHCDMKPENILLKSQNRSGIRLIDFGSACYQTRRVFKYIQSRFYRSPEVILNLEYSTPIDRWSLGCVLIELHTGVPIFDGRTEAQQLAKFENILGPIKREMVEASPRKAKFFNDDGTLKEPLEAAPRTIEDFVGAVPAGPRAFRLGQPNHEPEVYRDFFDFVKQLLRYDPAERISCADCLAHPFLAPMTAYEDQQKQHQSSVPISQPPHSTAGDVAPPAPQQAAAAEAAASSKSPPRS